MKFKNVMLVTANLERALEFYRNVLGLRVTADFGANVTLTGGLCLQTLPSYREFIGGKDVGFKGNDAEIYFEEDDFDAFAAALTKHKIDYVHLPYQHRWGQRVVRFYDPDGHIVEVGENLAAVCQRFLSGGMTPAEIAGHMEIPLGMVNRLLKNN